MAVLFALAASALYGTADFFGGLASRRATTFGVATISQLIGLATLLLALPFLPASTPARSDIR
ncbi:MAG: EamA/RhaT family transporter, partial [Gemmatimonadaceae bacterium]|nr:EamA/RhaT family transporter [Gemmatimonadaceae bacterium]